MSVEDHLTEKLRAAVRRTLTLLAERNYDALSKLTAPESHLKAEEIESALRRYPGIVRMPSESELTFDAIEVKGSCPRSFSVDAAVFTVEEGKSDLTARITVRDAPGDDFEVIYHDTWVM